MVAFEIGQNANKCSISKKEEEKTGRDMQFAAAGMRLISASAALPEDIKHNPGNRFLAREVNSTFDWEKFNR